MSKDSSSCDQECAVDSANNSLRCPEPHLSTTAGPSNDDNTSRNWLFVKIVSASYGPCEGLARDETSTRDVTPFLQALLLRAQADEWRRNEELTEGNGESMAFVNDSSHDQPSATTDNMPDDQELPVVVRFNSLTTSGMRRREIILLEHASMNAIFGDPCSGTSKRLHIDYMLSEQDPKQTQAAADDDGWGNNKRHRLSFAEHERIVLRDEYYRATKASATSPSADFDAPITIDDRDVGRTVNLAVDDALYHRQETAAFHAGLAEILLPIVLTYLDIRERVQLQLVCKDWSRIVRHWGVATSIDSCDADSFPNFTRPVLRGILNNSYASLQCLFLSDFVSLEEEDLSNALPHLRKLRYLDVSRCRKLGDDILSQLYHASATLEVLYIKELRNVTDTGLVALARSCLKLRALDVSGLRQLTDASALEIGLNLVNLRALYLRDNYKLTSQGIDAITQNCNELEQLTLWGSIRMQRFIFVKRVDAASSCLRMLNLWGCHGLDDTAAEALQGMVNLRTLIVAECHKLTDVFVVRGCLRVCSAVFLSTYPL